MDNRLREILTRLDGSRARLRAVLADVPDSVLQQRPAAHRWSGAEVLEHLILVERRVHALLQHVAQTGAIDAATAGGRPHLVNDRVLLDRERRFTTSETFTPHEPRAVAAIMNELEDVRRAFVTLLAAADADRLVSADRPHPIAGTLNGLQWADFVGAHEARHTAQIVETLQALPPTPEA